MPGKVVCTDLLMRYNLSYTQQVYRWGTVHHTHNRSINGVQSIIRTTGLSIGYSPPHAQVYQWGTVRHMHRSINGVHTVCHMHRSIDGYSLSHSQVHQWVQSVSFTGVCSERVQRRCVIMEGRMSFYVSSLFLPRVEH